MNDGTETLRARLNKHAAEITTLEDRHRKLVRFWKGLFLTTLAWGILGFSIAVYLKISSPPPSNWRADSAPALQRVYVVTEGFVDKKGEWRNLTNGERIEVKHWLMP